MEVVVSCHFGYKKCEPSKGWLKDLKKAFNGLSVFGDISEPRCRFFPLGPHARL